MKQTRERPVMFSREALMMARDRTRLDRHEAQYMPLATAATALVFCGCAAVSFRGLESATVEIRQSNLTVSEESLGTLTGAHPGTIRLCERSDGDRFAYAKQDGDQWTVVLDGKEGQSFDKIYSTHSRRLYPGFNDDCSQFLYAGLKETTWYVVDNNVIASETHESNPATSIESFVRASPAPPSTPVIAASADISIVEEDRERFVVVNGEELKRYSVGAKGGPLEKIAVMMCFPVDDCSFSGDGPLYPIYRDAQLKRVGYLVKHNKGLLYVIDEVEYGPYDPYTGTVYGGPIVFSPDGSHFAFQANRGSKAILNIDGIDTLITSAIHYRPAGTIISEQRVFPYRYIHSNRLQTYAIRHGQLVRLVFDLDK